MFKANHLSSLLLVLFILQLSLISVKSGQSHQEVNFPSWFNFKKNSQKFTLSNPLNKVQIQFEAEHKSMKAISITITNQGYWKSVFKSQTHQLSIIGKGENALFQISTQSKEIEFSFKGLSQDEVQHVYLSTTNSSISAFTTAKQACQTEKNQIKCKFENKLKIYIFYHTSKTLQALEIFKQQKDASHSHQVTQFAESLNIKLNDQNTAQNMIKSMLTHSLSSLCVEQSEYQGFQFYGFCSNINTNQIDRHYSLLVIDILFKYNANLAVWLVENFLDLLQEKLFYSFSGRQWIPVPEHIEVFVTYLRYLKENSTLPNQQIRKRINKVVQIQNGLINSLLLSQVNHLSEEINYRQNKKVHPTILKMLNQVWKTDLPRARVSSIYAESFTNDFFYHEQNEKLQTSVGKMIWLIKLINQHINVIKRYGDSYQKESLQQLVSLSKVMHGYVLDDPKAHNGDFYSIVLTQNMKVYTRSVGYESLLPFSYDISPAFPTTTMFNLTTSVGLASLPSTNERARQTYNFRGNINLYFNYKILFGMIQRTSENLKYKIYYNGLKTVIQSLQKIIVESFVNAEKQQSLNFFTSWNPQGKGVTAENYLAVINVAFLKDFDVKSQASSQADNQNKRSQQKTQTVK